MSEITWTCPEFSGRYGNPNLDKLLTDIESNFDFADRDWPLERRNGDDSVSEDKENFTVALEVLTVVEEEAQDVLQVINNEVMGYWTGIQAEIKCFLFVAKLMSKAKFLYIVTC